MIKVYSLENCIECEKTKKRMRRKGIEFIEKKIEENPGIRSFAKEQGFMKAPIVVTENESWSGFNPRRIDALEVEVEDDDLWSKL